jgi:hypothetical protein
MAEPIISLTYGPCTVDGQTSIEAVITNEGAAAINSLNVLMVFDYETPQEATDEFRQLHPDVPVTEASITQHAEHLLTEDEGPLAPNATRGFFLLPDSIPSVLSFVESLPAENYRLTIEADGVSESVIAGQTLYEFVHRVLES